MKSVTNSTSLAGSNYQFERVRFWKGREVKKHYLSSETYLLSKVFLENCSDLEKLPKATSGSAPVYFPPNLPVVFKKAGKIKSLSRFNTMCKLREFCEKKNYKFLKIPKANPYGEFIIEERLPIVEFSQKRQVSLYSENKEKFSLAVKEFTQLLCYVDYPDILTSIHPYQKDLDIPLARYDNIPLFLENERGMIGLIDLEDVKIRETNLSREDLYQVAKKAALLFPYHLEEIIHALKELFPEQEWDIASLTEEHSYTLNNFNKIYSDHICFILNKKSKCEIPFVSEFRKSEIEKSILEKIDDLDQQVVSSIIKQLIDQIEIDLRKSTKKDLLFDESNINLADSRTLTLPFKQKESFFLPDVIYSIIIKAILKELEKGNEICYYNLYSNYSGELKIRIQL